jgi:glycosyltransferase involved in cell wall biosynthesis
MSKKALYLPGPSYYDENVKAYAGWHKILELQHEALEDAGYEVTVPFISPDEIDTSSSFARIASWSLAASRYFAGISPDLVLGAPSYAHHTFFLSPSAKNIAYVWNNSDTYRIKQLEPEYGTFNTPFPTHPVNTTMNSEALKRVRKVIACSEFVRNTWGMYQVPNGTPIDIAHWGVDSDLFHPGKKNSKFTILFVGGDPIRKGLRYLLRALKDIEDQDIEIWLAGCKIGSLDPRVTELGIIEHKHMPELIRQAHALVLPTLEDGIALCVQEAMASGVVPITTLECSEVFQDFRSGLTIPYRDHISIKAYIEALMNNRDLLRNISKHAREEAQGQTWDQFKEEFVRALR